MINFQNNQNNNYNKRISLAPMIDWTVREFRDFARLFNPYIYLYTEMISTSAILKGDTHHLLHYNKNQHPLVLQLGGSCPEEMAKCAKIAENFAYDEININVGCPSDRVQHNKIGACLMAEPRLVFTMAKAMRQNTDKPITIKHRIGIDTFDSYEFMKNFVETVMEAGIRHFIVHARSAWLKGLSPKENREIPPLRYEYVYQLKSDFPELFIEINGGIDNLAQITKHLSYVDGVMIGRAFYHQPMLMGECMQIFGQKPPSYAEIFDKLMKLLGTQTKQGLDIKSSVRHYLGLFHGLDGARIWRQTLSDKKTLTLDKLHLTGEKILQINQLRNF